MASGAALNGRRIAGVAFVAIAFLFLGSLVFRNFGDLRAQEWSVRPALLVTSLVVHIVGLVWGVGVWKVLLGRIGYAIPLTSLARIWFISGLGRYIPGKI